MALVITAMCGVARSQPGANTENKPGADDSKPVVVTAPLRLFEQDAFDQITLKDESVVKVQPLDFKGRQVPKNPKPGEKIVVRTLADTSQEYEIEWRDIASIKLFEQAVLEEAQRLTAEGKLDEAFDYFAFLEQVYPKFPGLAEATQAYLYEDAKAWQRKGQFDQALSLLNEIHARNPQFDLLEKSLAAATDKLVEQKMAAGQYRAAQKLIEALGRKYPNSQTANTWLARLSGMAREELAKAQAELSGGNPGEAIAAAQRAIAIWPLEEARQVWAEAHKKWPRVVVGVTVPASAADANLMIDWANRRSTRLLHRRLLEFKGYGPAGGTYVCPIGELEQSVGLSMTLKLRPRLFWSSGEDALTSHDVAQRLMAISTVGHPGYRADWADLLGAISIPSPLELEIILKRNHVHPSAMLQTILLPWAYSTAEQAPVALGPYHIHGATSEEVRYQINARYFAAGAQQPKEVVERYYADGRKAVAALKAGEIALLDRVQPWDIHALRKEKHLVVEPYAAPTIHCLIPNYAREIMADRNFRRGLNYGIDRNEILRTQLLLGADPAAAPGRAAVVLGSEISGPFPRGTASDDALGYAYNEKILPRIYEPRTAFTLMSVAHQQLVDRQAAEKARQSPPPSAGKSAAETAKPAQTAADKTPPRKQMPLPTLVLAHPPHEIARVACRSIKRQLALTKMDITLHELPLDAPAFPSGDWDLLYAELAIWDPVVDARYLLGPGGLTGSCSPYMDLALRRLEVVENWKLARERLLDVHRVAHEDAAVIPLWQLTDHLAYHKGLVGVGARPASLYQNIEGWQVPAWFSAEAP